MQAFSSRLHGDSISQRQAKTSKDIPIEAIVYALAMLTQPTVAVTHLYIEPHVLIGLTSVAIANAATYALLGLIVEKIRQHHRPIHIST